MTKNRKIKISSLVIVFLFILVFFAGFFGMTKSTSACGELCVDHWCAVWSEYYDSNGERVRVCIAHGEGLQCWDPGWPCPEEYTAPPSYPSYSGPPSYPPNYPSYPSYPSYGNPSYPSYPSYGNTYPSYPSYPSYPNYPSYGNPSYPVYPNYPSYTGTCAPSSSIATGGTITTATILGVVYKIHTFTSSGTFTAGENMCIEYLVVGGGGGGGAANNGGGTGGGGGGGGGVKIGSTNITTAPTAVTVGGSGSPSSCGPGTAGGSSSIGSLVSVTGGGYGAYANCGSNVVGGNGGSGGGGGRSGAGGTGIVGEGNNGGSAYIGSGAGGGGGGKGGAGTNGTLNVGGNGGAGTLSSMNGSSWYYGGGGGGGGGNDCSAGSAGGAGGSGVGGNGGTCGNGGSGATNRGGGGGGAGVSASTGVAYSGGTGGTGIVIIRYPYVPPTPDLISSGVTPTTVTVNTVQTYTATITNSGTGTTGASFPYFFQTATASNGGGTITDRTSSTMSTLASGASGVATSPSITFSSAGTYSIRVCADKTDSSSTGSITESNEGNNCSNPWTDVIVTTTPVPVVTISVSSVAPSGSSGLVNTLNPTIIWSATNSPTSCTASGSWTTNGSKPTSGSEAQGVITSAGSYTYYLTCANAGGSSSVASVTVVATNPSTGYPLIINGNSKPPGGKVTSSDANINCGSTCLKNYTTVTNVILTPTPDSSYWKFTGWAGDCSGTGTCTITVGASNKSVIANFAPRLFNYKEF